MANSKYEYVRGFEKFDPLLPSTYIVVRVDGRAFHKVSKRYQFRKPNDQRALRLMNASAAAVLREISDIAIAYGVSDEFSFVFERDTALFERRESKLVSTVTSTFTAYYVHYWKAHFPEIELSEPLPTFDGRAVTYPNLKITRDYLSWRQVDCHINNLYNTTFWALVEQGGLSQTEAEAKLKGTVSSDKHEILFSQFSINYNNEEDMFKKGSVIYRDLERSGDNSSLDLQARVPPAPTPTSKRQAGKEQKRRKQADITIEYLDIIRNDFWAARPWILDTPDMP